jgi:hypothetical protein
MRIAREIAAALLMFALVALLLGVVHRVPECVKIGGVIVVANCLQLPTSNGELLK